jgi:hypothetical protein
MTLLNPVTHIDLPVQEPVNTMRTLHRAMRDLDTYCIDGIWYTIWHKDQLPHGQAVEAFRQVDGTGMQIGQPLTIHAEDGHVVQQGRITAIRIVDPARETVESTAPAADGHTPARCWYITLEPAEDSQIA